LSYFIGEVSGNLLDEEIDKILISSEIEKLLFDNYSANPNFQDIYRYVLESALEKTKIFMTKEFFHIAMYYYIKKDNHTFAKLIIEDKLTQLIKSQSSVKEVYKSYMEDSFMTSNYDVSEKIYFYLRANLNNGVQLGDVVSEIQRKFQNELILANFEEYQKPAYFLPFHFINKIDWDIIMWVTYIEPLNSRDFQIFCLYTNLPLENINGTNSKHVSTHGIQDEEVADMFILKAVQYSSELHQGKTK